MVSSALSTVPARSRSSRRMPSPPRAPRVLIVAFYFPPAGGGGVQRPLKFAAHLPAHGIETHVLAPDDPKWIDRDEGLAIPDGIQIHRAHFPGPRARRPAEELYGLTGLRRASRRGRLLGRRLLVPDENIAWVPAATAAAVRIAQRERIDAVVTTSPPGSIHLVGAAVKRLTGVHWIADLRDPLVAHPHRRVESRLVRVKEIGPRVVERLVARRSDAVIAASEAIAAEFESSAGGPPIATIASGADFDDFDRLEYRRGERFRITHTGSFLGRRDPRPFLSALERVDGVEARFVGDSRAADRDWAAGRALHDRLEWIPFTGRAESLRLQRDSEALLLLIPEADGRGEGILSGKVFEYLGAGRPVLALVPPDGAASHLLRESGVGVVVAPDDVAGAARELERLRDRWLAGDDLEVRLAADLRESLSRKARVADLASLIGTLTSDFNFAGTPEGTAATSSARSSSAR
jgi:glycosyltransferase involved in cell wall biosynthesis